MAVRLWGATLHTKREDQGCCKVAPNVTVGNGFTLSFWGGRTDLAFPYKGENLRQFSWGLLDQPMLVCWLVVPDEEPVV